MRNGGEPLANRRILRDRIGHGPIAQIQHSDRPIMTPKQLLMRKKKAREWQARRRAALQAAGLCVQCGHEYPRENSTRCEACLKYQAEKTALCRKRKGKQ